MSIDCDQTNQHLCQVTVRLGQFVWVRWGATRQKTLVQLFGAVYSSAAVGWQFTVRMLLKRTTVEKDLELQPDDKKQRNLFLVCFPLLSFALLCFPLLCFDLICFAFALHLLCKCASALDVQRWQCHLTGFSSRFFSLDNLFCSLQSDEHALQQNAQKS